MQHKFNFKRQVAVVQSRLHYNYIILLSYCNCIIVIILSLH